MLHPVTPPEKIFLKQQTILPMSEDKYEIPSKKEMFLVI
jgi:hypothetical protein